MEARNSTASGRAASFLNCPCCGLSIRPSTRGLTVEHCPRCMAVAGIPVTLFSSALPAAELYRDGLTPRAEQRGVTAANPTGSTGGASPHPTWASR